MYDRLLSVISQCCTKVAIHRITKLAPYDSLRFLARKILAKFEWVTAIGGRNTDLGRLTTVVFVSIRHGSGLA